MDDLTTRILDALRRPSYTPLKPKVLAKRLNLDDDAYQEFRRVVRQLIHDGKVDQAKDNTLRLADAGSSVVGTYRRTNSGLGFVRPDPKLDHPPGPDIQIRLGREKDAANGDRVLVRIRKPAGKTSNASGEIVRVIERGTKNFVGTYFERDGEGYVRVDGIVFAHSVSVGDPGAKGVKPQDKVLIEMVRFPTDGDRGEGVIAEVFGPLSKPGVDLLTVIRAFGIPDEFPEEALAEARQRAAEFDETDLDGRTDFTNETVITIDPVDARDFDDAVSVTIDPATQHRILTVHIADVAHFAKLGGLLDTEARKRGTSVYLPQKVIPMFPEVISNGLASLQQGKVRYVKSVRMEFTADGQKGAVQFFNGAIRVARRFTYEQAQEQLETRNSEHGTRNEDDVFMMLQRMKELALVLKERRFRRGSLELSMPEAVLEYDTDGKVGGAHFAVNDLSHQVIEEFMLAANEAVAEHFTQLGVPFLRRVHPMPAPEKLKEFADFAALLGYPMKQYQNRFELQRLLHETADKPERAAIHYALLRSLKQATYSPVPDEHFALASQHYCHFTSPIRRYPDLQVHRLLDRWLRTGKAAADRNELLALGDHCSQTERRAEKAERELVKLRILQFLAERLGEQFVAVITGVAEYGFFAQAERFPAEGLVHIASLTDDYYHFDESARTLRGGRSGNRYRLGDRVRVEVARVDLQKRLLDLRLVRQGSGGEAIRLKAPAAPRPGKKSGKPKGLPKKKKR